jgi:hypothetical protein
MTTPNARPRAAACSSIGPSPEDLTGGMARRGRADALTLGCDESLPGRSCFGVHDESPEARRARPTAWARHVRQFARRCRGGSAIWTRPSFTCTPAAASRSIARSADLMLARRLGCRTVLARSRRGVRSSSMRRPSGIQQTDDPLGAGTAADAVIALSGGWSRELRAMSPRAHVVEVVENAVAMPPPIRVANPHDGACRFVHAGPKMDLNGRASTTCWMRWRDACAGARGTVLELTLAGPRGNGRRRCRHPIASSAAPGCRRCRCATWAWCDRPAKRPPAALGRCLRAAEPPGGPAHCGAGGVGGRAA